MYVHTRFCFTEYSSLYFFLFFVFLFYVMGIRKEKEREKIKRERKRWKGKYVILGGMYTFRRLMEFKRGCMYVCMYVLRTVVQIVG